jgi:beta-glucanase (GH16 family)
MDGVLYNTIINEHKSTKEWPFDQPFYMILNLAIGGDWGGKKGIDENIFPAVFEIDYVRVYKQAE